MGSIKLCIPRRSWRWCWCLADFDGLPNVLDCSAKFHFSKIWKSVLKISKKQNHQGNYSFLKYFHHEMIHSWIYQETQGLTGLIKFLDSNMAPPTFWRDHISFCIRHEFDYKTDLEPQFKKAFEGYGCDYEQIRGSVSSTSRFSYSGRFIYILVVKLIV